MTAEEVVILEYADLIAEPTEKMHALLEKAYGYDGLGILAVRGIPNFAELRSAGLPYGQKFGELPEEIKAKYEHPESFYSFGWSHGKEKLEGKPDTAKGSFYNNPVFDRPVDDEELINKYPAFIHPNIWPSEEDCAGFRDGFMNLGGKMVSIGCLIARHCDAFCAAKNPLYKKTYIDGQGLLERTVRNSRCAKARLLYYFPVQHQSLTNDVAAEAGDVSSWCGWHNDHGTLTALTPAMFFNREGEQIPCPDVNAGLYIRSRHNEIKHMKFPADCLAFQIGETAQVHTGGLLQATPHCVRAADVEGVSRSTMAVFMEPEWDWPMGLPEGAEQEAVLRGAKGELLPKGVPALGTRWENKDTPMSFDEFSQNTFKSYY